MILRDACYNSDEKIVDVVLDRWANGNEESKDQDIFAQIFQVVLHWAIGNRHERVLQMLAKVRQGKEFFQSKVVSLDQYYGLGTTKNLESR